MEEAQADRADDTLEQLLYKLADFLFMCCEHYVVQTCTYARMNRMILLGSL